MKKIVLYDRCRLTDGMMPEPHKEMMDEINEIDMNLICNVYDKNVPI